MNAIIVDEFNRLWMFVTGRLLLIDDSGTPDDTRDDILQGYSLIGDNPIIDNKGYLWTTSGGNLQAWQIPQLESNLNIRIVNERSSKNTGSRK